MYQEHLYQYAVVIFSTRHLFTFCTERMFLRKDLKHNPMVLALQPSSFPRQCSSTHGHLSHLFIGARKLLASSSSLGQRTPSTILSLHIWQTGVLSFDRNSMWVDNAYKSYGPFASSALAGQSLCGRTNVHLRKQ